MKITENSKFKKLAEKLQKHYEVHQKKGRRGLLNSLGNVTDYFVKTSAKDVAEQVLDYKEKRQADGMSNDSINLELRLLNRCFTICNLSAPATDKNDFLKSHIREGIFTIEEYQKILNELPAYCKPLVALAFSTGARKNELLNLLWDDVNLDSGKLLFRDTKNGESRAVFVKGDVLQMLRNHRVWVTNKNPTCPYVFTFDGKNRLESIKRQWANALKKTGLEGRLFHDFRRSCLTNLINANIPQTTAQKISGHKSSDVFQRYKISTEKDIEEAAQVYTEYLIKNTASPITDIGLPIAI